jgi:predicted outer membrane protein
VQIGIFPNEEIPIMKLSSIALLAALTVTSPAFAQDAAKPADTATQSAAMAVTDPQQFAEKATVSNMFEIESSKVALEKATGEEAKAFAQHMIDDHTKAGEEMKAAADAQGNITLPAALDAEHQGKVDQLKGLSGEQFDSEYLSMQLAAHQDAVALFDGYSKDGAEGELKTFAQKTLPTLQSHLADVEKIAQTDMTPAADAAMAAPAATEAPTADAAMSAPASTEAPAADANTTTSTTAAAAPDSSILASGYNTTDKDNLSTEIIGKQVYSSDAADAEHIGDVNNLVIGENGQVAAVIIGVGGFLGIGEKNVAVNYSELQWVTAEDDTERFVLATTKESLEAAPDFKTTDEAAPAN